MRRNASHIGVCPTAWGSIQVGTVTSRRAMPPSGSRHSTAVRRRVGAIPASSVTETISRPSGQERVDLVVARVADQGDVVVVADAVAAAGPFDELEKQLVGDDGHGFGLGRSPSPETDLFGHRPRAVDGQQEGGAVPPGDALRIHGGLRVRSVRGRRGSRPCGRCRRRRVRS